MLNATQKKVIEKYINDLLDEIQFDHTVPENTNFLELDQLDDSPPRSPELVYRALFYILKNICTREIEAHFKKEKILEEFNSLTELLHIHQFPQNRTTGAHYTRDIYIDGVLNVRYYDEKGSIIAEPKGLLSLTVYNRDDDDPVNREDVVSYASDLIRKALLKVKESTPNNPILDFILKFNTIFSDPFYPYNDPHDVDKDIDSLLKQFDPINVFRGSNTNTNSEKLDLIKHLITDETFDIRHHPYFLLRHAALTNDCAIFKLILDEFKDHPYFEYSIEIEDIIILAIESNNITILQYILDKYNNSPYLTNGINNSPLYHAIKAGNFKALDILLKRGANPNMKCNENGLSAFQTAIISGKYKNVLAIVNRINPSKNEILVKINQAFPDGDYPLDKALIYNSLHIANLLIAHGANLSLNLKEKAIFMTIDACKHSRDEHILLNILKYLIKDKSIKKYLTATKSSLLIYTEHRFGKHHFIYKFIKSTLKTNTRSNGKRSRPKNDNLNAAETDDRRPFKFIRIAENNSLFFSNEGDTPTERSNDKSLNPY